MTRKPPEAKLIQQKSVYDGFINRWNELPTRDIFSFQYEKPTESNNSILASVSTSESIPPGHAYKTIDDHGRRIICVGTCGGIISIFFERIKFESDGKDDLNIVGHKTLLDVLCKFSFPIFNLSRLNFFVGNSRSGEKREMNIGERLEMLRTYDRGH